jgi:hypothetical protein
MKEPAMASMARRDHPNLRMALDRGDSKHGVGNEGIVLRCDDEGGDGDGIEHMVCPGPIVIVRSAGIPPIRGGILVRYTGHRILSSR